MNIYKKILFTSATILSLSFLFVISASAQETGAITDGSMEIDNMLLGFKIPTLADLLTFAIRGFFVVAGLAALFNMMMGALAWITSGGDKEAVAAAGGKIQAAVLGLLMVVVVLSLVWTLEQIIFSRRICLGLTCPVTIPVLLESN
jgi:hypothetical protein